MELHSRSSLWSTLAVFWLWLQDFCCDAVSFLALHHQDHLMIDACIHMLEMVVESPSWRLCVTILGRSPTLNR